MRSVIREIPQLPRLGWVAQVSPAFDEVVIECGPRVERGDGWVVEGVWEGPFGSSFARAPHLFGSGVRVTDDSVEFVPSCALVDRLVWAESGGAVLVSNSLALLLARVGWRLTPRVNYVRSLYAITKGITGYDDTLPASGGLVHQLYYRNMALRADGRMSLTYKAEARGIATFGEYRELMRASVKELGANMSDARRAFPVRAVATISRGYDSPAVCALARGLGLTTCYTSPRSNSMIPSALSAAATDDDGTVVARALGLETRVLTRTPSDELFFLAGSDEPELVFAGLAADIRRSGDVTVLLTGYHGDMVWRADAFSDDRAAEIIRHDISGLNLGELRLDAGFFNVPLTFLHVRSQASITRISQSPEMTPWRTFTDYDRPIPRRLLMEAGVDGTLFGRRKKAVVDRPYWPVSPDLRRDFIAAVHEETGHRPRTIAAMRVLDALSAVPVAAFKRVGIRLPEAIRPRNVRPRLYVWAVNRLADRYQNILAGGDPARMCQTAGR
jgi:hypothetical protein